MTPTDQPKRILLCLAHMSGNEMKYIQEAFDTNWVVPLGPNVNGFEADLERFIASDDDGGIFIETATPVEGTAVDAGALERLVKKRVVALASGTSAVHLALVGLDVKAGDEVIVQSMTFSASANPVVYQGATPVFVDSERDTWNIDPNLLEDAIKDRIAKTGRKPKAIIPVYLYGMPAKLDEIMEIAKRYDIPVVEDSAEGFGSRYRGMMAGTFGNYGVMSFNGNKMITTSGGGALICPDEEAKRRTMYFATQSRQPLPYYLHLDIGYNYRMSNICAGIGRGQMTVVNEHLAHHKHICKMYAEAFSNVEGITVHTNPDERYDSNFWLNTILVDPAKTGGVTYDDIRLHLESKNIESRPLWNPMHAQPFFSGAPAYVNGVSEDLFQHGLCLPSGPMVTDDDTHRVITEILNCVKK